MVALVLGAAVLLPALFWLPPFAGHGGRGPPPGAQDPFADGFTDDIVASFRLQKYVSELRGNMSKLVLDIYAKVGAPNSIVCPHHIFYFTVLIRSSTSVDRCLNAMFPLSWPRSSKEMTAMFSFGLVLLEIITGKRAVMSDEPDDDDETLVSWVGLSQVPWIPPPLVKLGAKSEELLFASPRLASHKRGARQRHATMQ